MSWIKENGQQIVKEILCLLGYEDEIFLKNLSERPKEKEEKSDIEKRYYGDKKARKESQKAFKNLRKHLIDDVFQYQNNEGQWQGKYKKVGDYKEKERDLAVLKKYKLEDIVKLIEIDSKRNNKGYQLTNEEQELEENFLKNNYISSVYTNKNLGTLGNYGEKVAYTKFDEKRRIKNVVIATGNLGKFVRNHSIAPISSFVGHKIAQPIHSKMFGNYRSVKSVFKGPRTHRYVARRDFIRENSKNGYLKSCVDAVLKYKKYNEKVINNKIKEGTTDAITRAQHEEANKRNVTRVVTILKAAAIAGAKLVGPQIHKWLQERVITAQTNTPKIPNQTIEVKEHTSRVTRESTNIRDSKGVSSNGAGNRATASSNVGTKMADLPQTNTTRHWVEPVTEYRTTPVFKPIEESRLYDIIAQNANQNITGYATVFGDSKGPQEYILNGTEKITALFQQDKSIGVSMSSDMTNNLFNPGVIDQLTGTLNQNISFNDLTHCLREGTVDVNDLSNTYVLIDDKYWTSIQELFKNVIPEQIGSKTETVVLKPGHWEEVVNEVTDKLNAASSSVANGIGISKEIKPKMTREGLNEYLKNYSLKKAQELANKGKNVEFALIYDKAKNIAEAFLGLDMIYDNFRKTKEQDGTADHDGQTH